MRVRTDGGRPSWKRMASRPGVWCLLFGLAAVFFNWPLLAAYLDAPLLRAHVSLFTIWVVFVVCLYALCRAAGRGDAEDEGSE